MRKLLCLLIFLLILSIGFLTAKSTSAFSAPSKLKGKILLQVESKGEAWYVSPADGKRHSMGRPDDAFNLMRQLGVGISNENLKKIKIANENLTGQDSDNDGLSAMVEDSIGTDKNNPDSDGDGYSDKDEIMGSYNPSGSGKLSLDNNFAKSQSGRILLQVEKHGEAWYVNPDNNQRYFMGRPGDAFNLMLKLGLGISNNDLNKIIRAALNSDWLEYSDGDYGYTLKYPSNYRLADQSQNNKGTQKFIYPNVPGTGVWKILEIIDTEKNSTSTPHQFMVKFMLGHLNSEAEFDLAIAQMTSSFKEQEQNFTYNKITFAGSPAYKFVFTDSNKKSVSTSCLVYHSSMIFSINYAPPENSTMEEIASSFSFKNVTIDTMSDAALYESAKRNKNSSFCDHIKDAILKEDCYIIYDGEATVDEIPINLSSVPAGSGGDGKMENGTINLSTQKGAHSWVTVAIIIGADGWKAISFDAELFNNMQSQSLLGVYLNTDLIGTIDGRVAIPGKQRYSFALPPKVNPGGLYGLGFTLDSFAEGTTSAIISNFAGVRVH